MISDVFATTPNLNTPHCSVSPNFNNKDQQDLPASIKSKVVGGSWTRKLFGGVTYNHVCCKIECY